VGLAPSLPFWYNGVKENTMPTDFLNKCSILNEFRDSFLFDEPQFKDFVYQHNSLMLPLARLIYMGDVVPMQGGVEGIDITWKAFLEVFGVEDKKFEFLYDVTKSAGKGWSKYIE
jgi:hypothetical protein